MPRLELDHRRENRSCPVIALTLLLTALSGPALAGEKLVLIAERLPIGGPLEQMAVIFEDAQVRTTSNANFLGEEQGPKGSVRLGHLRSPMNPLLELEKRR